MPQSPSQGSTLDKPVAKGTPSGGSTLRRGAGPASAASSPEHSDHALSASSDSGLSNASLWTERGSSVAPSKSQGPSQQEKAELKRLLSGFGLDEPPPLILHGAMDGERDSGTIVTGGLRVLHPAQVHAAGEPQPKERETDILDDVVLMMSGHDLRSVDSLGTLSSSCHKSSQNSLLSDGFGSPGGPEDVAHHHHHLNHHNHQHLQHQQHAPAGMEEYERAYIEARRGCLGQRSGSVPVSSSPSPSPSGTGSQATSFRQGSYSTHSWVQQQQMVAAQHYSYLAEEVTEVTVTDGFHHGDKRGTSPLSEPAAEQGNGTDAVTETTVSQTVTDKTQDEEFNSLTVDIDNSIDQLNQLIMDLDPTFVPISTRTASVKRSGGTHANGPTTACTNGTTHRVSGNSRAVVQQAGKVQASLGCT